MQWRQGRHCGIHVYEGDRQVATFHREEDAKRSCEALELLSRIVNDYEDQGCDGCGTISTEMYEAVCKFLSGG